MDKKALVYKGLPPNHCCCDATFRILPNGEFAVFFMTGGTFEPEISNYIAMCRSTDQGTVWSDAETVLRYDDRACLLSEAYIVGGRIVIQVTTHDGGFGRWENLTIFSDDNGKTWSKPEPFIPMPRRAFIRTLYAASWCELYLPFQSYATVKEWEAAPQKDGSFQQPINGVLISNDSGVSWEVSAGVGGAKGWAENNVVELSDGKLVMLIRSDGDGCLVRTESTDRGRTWSGVQRTEIPNPGTKHRLHRLRDGRIVMIHNPNSQTSHPNSKSQAGCHRSPLAMWISEDDMQTWGYKRILTDFPGMLAYPDGVVDEEEKYVHFAFDYNRHDVIYWGAEIPTSDWD